MLKKDRGSAFKKLDKLFENDDDGNLEELIQGLIDLGIEHEERLKDLEDAVEKLQDEGISTDKVKEIANEIVDEFFN